MQKLSHGRGAQQLYKTMVTLHVQNECTRSTHVEDLGPKANASAAQQCCNFAQLLTAKRHES
jgi:hypothetical protein